MTPTMKVFVPHYVKVTDRRCANGIRNHRFPDSATVEDVTKFVKKNINKVVAVFPQGGKVFGYTVKEFFEEYLQEECPLPEGARTVQNLTKKTEYCVSVDDDSDFACTVASYESAMLLTGMLLYKHRNEPKTFSVVRKTVKVDESGHVVSVVDSTVLYTASTEEVSGFGVEKG